MIVHLPIVENRIAQFAARFERHGSEWVYYGDSITGGLPVSDPEHATLLAEHARRLRRGEKIMRWWLPVAVLACAAYELRFGNGDGPQPWRYAPVLLLPLPWVFWEWRRADQLAIELAGRRPSVTPPRSWGASAKSRITALPGSIGVMLFLASALLAVQSRPWERNEQRLWLTEAVIGMAAGLGLIWMKRRAR